MNASKDNMNLNVELYKKLYLIRRSEEQIIRYYHEDEMKTPMHMSMGGEAIAVGVCHTLKATDQVFGFYRSHAIYLAKTQDTDDFFAEMYAKDTARLKGKGGSMHLCAPDAGFMGTSAIVSSVIPVAAGAAFANHQLNNGKIVVVFLGDGAIDEGAFWETLNVACLMKLPLIFVCEDNGLAVHTTASQRHGYRSIADIVGTFDCQVFRHESTDVQVIYELACEAVKSLKATKMPSFLHLKYYRYLEHVGINQDFDAGYRSKEEFDEWYKVDPILLQSKKLARLGLTEDEIQDIETKINRRIDESITRAKAARFAEKEELYYGVFA
jgi:TPP-dependent pyruvate/acetoin dehydrogenase alpha subunit